ncbi:MAG: DEAD/DEAH box helicase [Promethearchaeota archaeon]
MQKEHQNYFNGPFLKKNRILYRQYQNNIVSTCKNKNSLVVLPTGLGKTIIAILLINYTLKKYLHSKVIILAPTRPLVSQHKDSCEQFLNINLKEIALLTGKITPEKRIIQFKNSKIIISTPQVIKNDLMRGRYDLTQVSLIVFDEAHKTKGNYAYNFLSKEYIDTCNDPLILGLTASPGKNYERIQEICDNLYIENIIFKNYEDEDVKNYIYEIDTYINFISLPIKIVELSEIWQNLFEKFLRFFIKSKLLPPNKPYYSKLDFLGISRDLTLSLRYEKGDNLEISDEEFLEYLYYKSPKIIDVVKKKNLNVESIFSYCSSCISLLHAKDLLETQDISVFKLFIEKIEDKASDNFLSAKRIINSEHFKHIKAELEKEDQTKLTHPKMNKIISIIKEEKNEFNNKKLLIFTQYRDMAKYLKRKLANVFNNQLKVEKFIGQTNKIDDNGFSQHKQIEILKKFREGKINILIATSVAEEGLDIPNVDAIIFYEPVPSEIRLIQRRGRTGRFAPGRCYILVTENTVDVPFHIVARRKEGFMKSVLSSPEQINLIENLDRKRITFPKLHSESSELDIITNFKDRKEKEKEFLANRSIEDIITQLDKFCNSKEFQNLKKCGVTFYSDLIKMELPSLKDKVLKLKSKKSKLHQIKKTYLNKNLRTLIKIAKTYSENGKLEFKKFQDLACIEEIIDRKFYVHFNQACNLGYLKKQDNLVYFLMDYE